MAKASSVSPLEEELASLKKTLELESAGKKELSEALKFEMERLSEFQLASDEEVDKLKSQVAMLNGEIETEKKSKKALEIALAAEKSQVDVLKGEVETEKKSKKALEIALAAEKSQVAVLKGEVETEKKSKKALEIALAAEKEKVGEVKKWKEKSIKNEEKALKLGERLADMKGLLATKELDLEESRKQNENLLQLSDAVSKLAATSELEISGLRDENDALKLLDTQKDELVKKMHADYDSIRVNLEIQLEEQTKGLQEVVEREKNLEEKVRAYEVEIHKKDEEVKELVDGLETMIMAWKKKQLEVNA